MGVLDNILNIFRAEDEKDESSSSYAQYLAYAEKESDVLNCMVAYNKFGGYCTPISSRNSPAVRTVLNGKVHNPETIDFIRKNCGDGDIVHAGTFFGNYLPAFANGMSDSAKIWTFEPHPINYRCAFLTMQINNIHNTVLFNAGLGARKTNTKMEVSNDPGEVLDVEEHVILKDENLSEERRKVDILPLDSVLPRKRKISVLHLDVGGYELQVLQGGLNTLKRWKPLLVLENVPRQKWMHDNLISNGYKKRRETGSATIFEFDK